MSGPDRPTCRTCAYWLTYGLEPDTNDKNEPYYSGRCRRHAPRPRVPLDETDEGCVLMPAEPRMDSDEWCGEHHLFGDYIAALKAARTAHVAGDGRAEE